MEAVFLISHLKTKKLLVINQVKIFPELAYIKKKCDK